MAGIYIHVPFCRQACHYCDFHFSTNVTYIEEMTAALCKELLLQKEYLSHEKVNTIYFGGGTPSLLNATQLYNILSTIKKAYPVSDGAEITLEANPDDLTLKKLQEIKDIGVNRLSIGIQSFDDNILKYLNRVHTSAESVKSFYHSREAGFSNISIDVIYAIPGLSLADWQRNIQQALALNAEHISSYSLTIEPKTTFGSWYSKGKLEPVHDDNAAQQLELLVHELEREGYEQYEVSNFSKPGFHSKHNSSYWRREKYLGIGPGAHSYNGSSRQFNVRNNHQYMRSISQNVIPFESEALEHEDHINEYLLTTLRTSWGADLKFLQVHFNHDVLSENGSYIAQLLDNKMAIIDQHHLILTPTGKLLADKIASDLFLVRP